MTIQQLAKRYATELGSGRASGRAYERCGSDTCREAADAWFWGCFRRAGEITDGLSHDDMHAVINEAEAILAASTEEPRERKPEWFSVQAMLEVDRRFAR